VGVGLGRVRGMGAVSIHQPGFSSSSLDRSSDYSRMVGYPETIPTATWPGSQLSGEVTGTPTGARVISRRLQRRAAASLILRLTGFLCLCEASTISVLRNLAALLRRYRLHRRTFVPGFARSLGSLSIFLLHILIGSAFLG